MMPILTTRSMTSVPTTPSGAVAPLLTSHAPKQHNLVWLGAMRQPFLHQAPQPIQVSDASLARRASQLIQHEVAFAAACQGLIVEVEQGIVALYGFVDTSRRKERLAEQVRTSPGVQGVVNHLLAEDELDARLQQRFQALVMAGELNHLPKLLVEQQMVELYGEVATPEHRNLLEHEALAVPGVRVVINHLSVPQESNPRVHTTNH